MLFSRASVVVLLSLIVGLSLTSAVADTTAPTSTAETCLLQSRMVKSTLSTTGQAAPAEEAAPAGEAARAEEAATSQESLIQEEESSTKGKKRVLLVGVTKRLTPYNHRVSDLKPFSPIEIGKELEVMGLQVTTVDHYRQQEVRIEGRYNTTFTQYSLASWLMWPDAKSSVYNLLKGDKDQGGPWDYVVITGDPYILAQTPGIYALGAHKVAAAVKEGGATPLLVEQWPTSSHRPVENRWGLTTSAWPFTPDHFREVVYRVAEDMHIGVVPAGRAWQSLEEKDVLPAGQRRPRGALPLTHPTPRGAMLTAAAIYSEIFDQEAPIPDSSLAKHALKVVQTERSVTSPRYPGAFTFMQPWSMPTKPAPAEKQEFTMCQTGTSTEAGISSGFSKPESGRLNGFKMKQVSTCRTTWTGKVWTPMKETDQPIDFNLGRATGEPPKQYRYKDPKIGLGFGFPFQDKQVEPAQWSMQFGLDERAGSDRWTDLDVCMEMVVEKRLAEGARCIPMHLIFAEMQDIDPTIMALKDSGHLSEKLDIAIAAYIATVVSGRCNIGEEPAGRGSQKWKSWVANRAGSATAWHLSTLSSKVCGGALGKKPDIYVPPPPGPPMTLRGPGEAGCIKSAGGRRTPIREAKDGSGILGTAGNIQNGCSTFQYEPLYEGAKVLQIRTARPFLNKHDQSNQCLHWHCDDNDCALKLSDCNGWGIQQFQWEGDKLCVAVAKRYRNRTMIPDRARCVQDAGEKEEEEEEEEHPEKEEEEEAEEEATTKLKAEEAAAAELKAEEEAAAKRKAEEEAAAKLKAEEETAAKLKAEEEAAAKLKAEEEAAAKLKAEEEAAAKLKAEEEAAAKLKAEQEAEAPAADKAATGAAEKLSEGRCKGDVIVRKEGISTVGDCQSYCEETEGCKFFSFRESKKKCVASRKCNNFSGANKDWMSYKMP